MSNPNPNPNQAGSNPDPNQAGSNPNPNPNPNPNQAGSESSLPDERGGAIPFAVTLVKTPLGFGTQLDAQP